MALFTLGQTVQDVTTNEIGRITEQRVNKDNSYSYAVKFIANRDRRLVKERCLAPVRSNKPAYKSKTASA